MTARPPLLESLVAALRLATRDPRTSLWFVEFPLDDGTCIRLHVDPTETTDSLPEPELHAAASAFCAAIDALDSHRGKIADDLHALYNQSWADEDPDEGPPELNRDQFIGALVLSSSTFYAYDGSMSLRFDCGDLFAGHSISLGLTPQLRPHGSARLFG